MSSTSQTALPAPARPGRASTGRVPHLGPRARKTTMVVHIVSGGAWIGIDVMVGVLVVVGWSSPDAAVRGIAYQALGRFVVWPMLAAGLTCLASGLVLGLGTRWGLLRYWWVAVKLALTVALCTLIIVVLRPGMTEVREHGEALTAGETATGDVSTLFFPPAVSLTVLTLATAIAVVKPWGRIGRARRRRDRRPGR